MIDSITKLPKRTSIVLNTDTTRNMGNHWTTFTHLNRGYHLYDPLGKGNERLTTDNEKSDLYLPKNTHIFPHRSQMNASDDCGYFAISIARKINALLRRKPSATAADIDRLIITTFGKTADWSDVHKLENEFSTLGRSRGRKH